MATLESTSIMTKARQALWEAIKVHPKLKDYFTKEFHLEDELGWLNGENDSEDNAPCQTDLPAIAIFPAPSTDNWVQNQGRELRYVLAVRTWFPTRSILEAEKIWQAICEAALNESIVNVTGQFAQCGGPVIVQATLDGARITQLTQQITLPISWVPGD